MASLLQEVPHALMEPFPNYEVILPGALPAFLAADADDIGAALGYIGGVIDHQNRVHEDKSKVFKGVIDKVTVYERKSGDYLLGRKATIHFTSSGDDDEQTIDTDWIEYRSFNPEQESFWVALSKSIVEIAENNIGIECLIRKAFKETGNPSKPTVRYIASLTPIKGSETKAKPKAKDTDDERPGKASTRSRSRNEDGADESNDDELTSAQIVKMISSHREAGTEYDDADTKVAKKIVGIITDTMAKSSLDDRYDEFADGLDLTSISKKLEDKIVDALELKTDKAIVSDLFIIALNELD